VVFEFTTVSIGKLKPGSPCQVTIADQTGASKTVGSNQPDFAARWAEAVAVASNDPTAWAKALAALPPPNSAIE
jgi:hypothetical protein